MSRKVEPVETQEYERLKKRVSKYLKYALVHNKPTDALIDSTIMFIEGERQRAVFEADPQQMTRWQHFKEIFK